jgi:methylated-DNA-protein-cysteine methyltransferase related protein
MRASLPTSRAVAARIDAAIIIASSGSWAIMQESETTRIEIAEQVWQVIVMIPKGTVATYGQIAALAGLPGGARSVGRILSKLPAGSRIPWHRVVNASGGISLPQGSVGHSRQRIRLEKEGVLFNKSGRIPLRQFRWCP